MNQNQPQDEGWQACPTGTLNQVIHHGQMKRRMNTLGKVTAIGTVSCLLLVVYALVFTSPAQTVVPGDLTCTEVLELLDDFKSGQVSPDLAVRVQEHLDKCVACREHLTVHASVESVVDTANKCVCRHCRFRSRHDSRTLFASSALRP